jgi:hypothetical protein
LKPLTIPYKVFPEDAFGAHSWSAVLEIQVALPVKNAPRTKRFEAIIDSSASRCLFHSDIAIHLGIDYRACPTEPTIGIGGSETTYLHELTLYIPGGPVTIKAGFKEALPVAALLGMNGFFDHFKIIFDGRGECCTLERIYKA